VIFKNKLILILVLVSLFIFISPSLAFACTYEATITNNHLDFILTSDVDKLAVIQYIRRSGSALVTGMQGADVSMPWTYSDDPNCNISLNDPIGCRQIRNGIFGTGAFWQWYDWPSSLYHTVPNGVWGLDFNSPPSYDSIGIEYGVIPGTDAGQAWTFCTRTIPTPPQTKLTVIKHVINDNSGTDLANNFTINVTGTNVSNSSFPGSETETTITLDPGSYSVDENSFSGYSKTIGADCSGTIAAGETKTCTITNDDIPPPRVTKIVFAPGFGASWNPNAFANCSFDENPSNWSLASYAESVYTPILNALTSAGWDTKPYYYDWRMRVPDSISVLSSFINSLAPGIEKINLLGHSMGGFLSAGYITDVGPNKTNSFMAIGSPLKGAVQSYPAWSGGDVWNDNFITKVATTLYLKHCGGFLSNDRQTIRTYIPSVQNFLPVFDYLKYFKTTNYKPWDSMVAKRDWPVNPFDFHGVKLGTLTGTGFDTLSEIAIKDRGKKDVDLGNWEDGKPTGKITSTEGDGSVLLKSSFIASPNSSTINQTHSGLVASAEGICKILEFLGSPCPTSAATFSEPNSALVIIGYPANFWASDQNGNLKKDKDGIISFINPKSGTINIGLLPKKQNTLFIVAQFLPNGQVLYKEYNFSNVLPKFKTIRFNLENPQEDILN